MKKLYTLTVVPIFLFTLGCSKDFLKSYETRIVGRWEITEVRRAGLGGNTGSLPFTEGVFTFSEGGSMIYTNSAGNVYKGSWDIRQGETPGDCYTNDAGNQQCDSRQIFSLQLHAIDFATQDVRSEFFNEIIFTGTNRFRAMIYSGARTYIVHFRR